MRVQVLEKAISEGYELYFQTRKRNLTRKIALKTIKFLCYGNIYLGCIQKKTLNTLHCIPLHAACDACIQVNINNLSVLSHFLVANLRDIKRLSFSSISQLVTGKEVRVLI